LLLLAALGFYFAVIDSGPRPRGQTKARQACHLTTLFVPINELPSRADLLNALDNADRWDLVLAPKIPVYR
jgi:hypothetical protein